MGAAKLKVGGQCYFSPYDDWWGTYWAINIKKFVEWWSTDVGVSTWLCKFLKIRLRLLNYLVMSQWVIIGHTCVQTSKSSFHGMGKIRLWLLHSKVINEHIDTKKYNNFKLDTEIGQFEVSTSASVPSFWETC